MIRIFLDAYVFNFESVFQKDLLYLSLIRNDGSDIRWAYELSS
jgi:hypothetical protein